jgi:DNA polymerase III subunit delta
VLELEAVTQQVADSARFDVFNLIDALLQGQPAHALRILQGLRSEGVAAPVVLWALGRELRSLAAMAHELSRGIPQERVFSSQRPPIWDKRKPLLAKALARHPAEHWENWLQLAQQADEQIKGQQPGDAWDSMTLLTAQASGLRLSL